MTDQPTGGISRVPYCTKVRYGISGAPVLTDDDMDGSHAPGVGVRPTLIELVYSRPRDGKPASVSAAVTGEWMRFGQRDGGEVTTHFAGSVEGWPTWLTEEARLHDPDAVPVSSPPPDQTAACFCRTNPALTAQIGYPVWCPHCPPTAGPVPPTHWTKHVQRHHPEAGPAVPPPPADRAAVLREAAEGLLRLCDSLITEPDVTGKYLAGIERSVTELRRLAAEAQQPDAETRP